MDCLINIDATAKRKTDVLTTEIDGTLVMMSIENGRYYGLNGVASIIWRILEQPATVKEIIARLMDEYEVSRERCELDVTAFLNELLEQGLIEIT